MIEILGTQFPVAYLHIGTLALTAIAILAADLMGFLWVVGKYETLPWRPTRVLHWLVGLGLTLMILTGVYMAWPMWEYLIGEVSFWIKMFFVAALVVNSFVIGRHMHSAAEKPFAEFTPDERKPLLISGAVSTIGWVGAFVAALYMTTSNWIGYILSELLSLL